MNKNNFTTIGTFGDTVYSLCLMKMLGGGNLYVKQNAISDFIRNVVGWPSAGEGEGRYTKQDIDILLPLLEAQDYLDHVAEWNGETDDYAQMYDHWKFHVGEQWQGNQTECYALALGMNIHDPAIKAKLLFESWLTPVDPIKIPGKPIVVNRTHRHLANSDGSGWHNWTTNRLNEYGIFIGTDAEHAAFEDQFKITIQHQKINDLLEMARYIQGCEQFIGNQSVALSIAIGLGKTYWCEIRKDFENTKTPHNGYGDAWFPRINGFYF
jgi:hypothetical protein